MANHMAVKESGDFVASFQSCPIFPDQKSVALALSQELLDVIVKRDEAQRNGGIKGTEAIEESYRKVQYLVVCEKIRTPEA
jgi:hypothetical protein